MRNIFFVLIILGVSSGLFAQRKADPPGSVNSEGSTAPVLSKTADESTPPQESSITENTESEAAETLTETKEPFEWPSFLNPEDAEISTGFRRNSRFFEIYLLNLNFGLSNLWFGAGEITQLAFDILGDGQGAFLVNDFLDKGELIFENSIFAKPLGVKFTIGNFLSLDIGTSFESTVFSKMSESTLNSIKTLQSLSRDPSSYLNLASMTLGGSLSAAGSAFGAVDAIGEVTILKGKLMLRGGPSLFIPFLYMPNNSMGFTGGESIDQNWYELKGQGSLEAWTRGDTLPLGVDIQAEARYAIFPILDVGVSAQSIPIVPASMQNKQSLSLSMNYRVPNPSNIGNLSSINLGDVQMKDPSIEFTGGETDPKAVVRPTRFNFYTVVKPFSSRFLIVKPEAGFSINTLVSSDAVFNWGLTCQVNLPVIFSASLTIKQFETIWNNALSFVLDFRFFELELGAALRGPTFESSWTGKGLNLFAGIRTGF